MAAATRYVVRAYLTHDAYDARRPDHEQWFGPETGETHTAQVRAESHRRRLAIATGNRANPQYLLLTINPDSKADRA